MSWQGGYHRRPVPPPPTFYPTLGLLGTVPEPGCYDGMWQPQGNRVQEWIAAHDADLELPDGSLPV